MVRNGKTYYPPDDSQPERQQFSIQNGYLYYDYAYAFGGDIVADLTFIPDSGATAGDGHPMAAADGGGQRQEAPSRRPSPGGRSLAT